MHIFHLNLCLLIFCICMSLPDVASSGVAGVGVVTCHVLYLTCSFCIPLQHCISYCFTHSVFVFSYYHNIYIYDRYAYIYVYVSMCT